MPDNNQVGGRGPAVMVTLIGVGSAVAVALGVFGRFHQASGLPISTLGFPTLIDMKVWLTTAAMALAVVQLITALGMYGRLGRRTPGRPARGAHRAATVHRVSGISAVILTLPVAAQCLWSLGLSSGSPRVLLHGVAGCLFYGVLVTKMLALHSSRVPGWALPVLGGTLFTVLVVVWLTSAVWFFANGVAYV